MLCTEISIPPFKKDPRYGSSQVLFCTTSSLPKDLTKIYSLRVNIITALYLNQTVLLEVLWIIPVKVFVRKFFICLHHKKHFGLSDFDCQKLCATVFLQCWNLQRCSLIFFQHTITYWKSFSGNQFIFSRTIASSLLHYLENVFLHHVHLFLKFCLYF